MKGFSLLIACILVVLNVAGQSLNLPIKNYAPQKILENVTPENRCITQDNNGIIYSGVGNGVLQYDGVSWRFIEVVQGATVWALASDEDGKIYVATDNNFGYLESDDKGRLKYISLSNNLPDKHQAFSRVYNIRITDKGVLFLSQERVFIYNNDELKAYTPEKDSYFHYSFYHNNEIYVRQGHKGLYKLTDDNFTFLEGTDTLAEMGVFGMFNVANKTLIVTYGSGFWWYDEYRGKVTPAYGFDDAEIFSSAVYGAIQLHDGNLALNTMESGVLVIDENLDIIARINKRKGLKVNDVKSVFQDKDLNLWLALENGIAKVDYTSPLSFYTEISNLEGGIQAITHFQNHLLVGTSSGLFINNNNQRAAKEFTHVNELHGQVWDFYNHNGQLLVASNLGLFAIDSIDYDGSYQIRKLINLPVNAIEKVESTDELILAGATGVGVFHGKTFEAIEFINRNHYGITNIVRTPSPDFCDEEFWIGTNSSGIIRLQIIDGFSFFSFYYGDDDDILNQFNTPFLYGDSVVFGEPRGLRSFMDEHYLIGENESIDDYPNIKGLFSHLYINGEHLTKSISQFIDTEERIWLCENGKILFLDKTNDFSRIESKFWGINFGRVNKYYLDQEHNLWIGAADGLVRYKYDDNKNYNEDFSTLIRSITINSDSSLYAGDGAISGGWEIDYEFNTIRFTFAAPNFNQEQSTQYSFMLEGQDDEWSEWTSSTEAIFTTLREGNYTFKVRAKNIYGQISEVSSVSFEILPPWHRTMWAYIAYVVAAIILIFILIRLSMIRLKRQNERLEEIVQERTKEIANKNVILQHQKDEILHQQTEIMDSINYAQRIQEAILPFDEDIDKSFDDAFVLFLPKDIVSGDFYWFADVDNHKIMVCADCTGHGVPGAFMSMIGSDKLNHFVKEKHIINPSLILSEINRGIKKSLKQSEETDSTRDGMDAAIISYDPDTRKLQYAGAHRSLWIVRNGEILETKATKTAVAGFTPEDQVYELHTFDMLEGDRVYMSSDGYADQFGGVKGKKLKVKVMKEFILEIVNKPMAEQREILHTRLQEWMGEYEQVDDVCVIGIRF